MNYKKGFFRITLIISIVSVIIGLFYGTNKLSSYYKEYERNLEIRQIYYSSMSKLLNEDIDNFKKDSLIIKAWEQMEPPHIKIIGGIKNQNNIVGNSLVVPKNEQQPPVSELDERLGLRERVAKSLDLVDDASLYSEEKKFKIKKTLFNNNSLESTIDGEYISIKRIIDTGLNKKLEESIKNKIADEYANANGSVLFPWKEVIIYILLLPLFFGSLIWIIYATIKYIVVGFKT